MSAGTLKLTNGSTAVTGTGTNFTVDLNAADFIVVTVGGTTHSLAIDTVTNTTELVLSAPFNGPTTDSVAWQAVPRKTMLRVTAELNKQVNEALRLANENSINWQAVLSSTDTVSVILPDGTMLTGLSWRKINDLLKALDVEHLDATAAQIHTDAQQVADDKPIIAQAKSDAIGAKDDAVLARDDAETAKNASETAQEKSEAAQVKSEAAQKAAEQAAATVHPENLLHKDQNLDDLTDKSTARSHLDVYSKAETDAKAGDALTLATRIESVNSDLQAKNIATNARIGYALLSVPNPALGSRTVLTNPFGNNVPVFCLTEIFHATLNRWITTPNTYNATADVSYGIVSSYSEGEGIVVKCGNNSFVAASQRSLSSQEFSNNYTTPSSVRIHVWKVTA